MLYKKSENYFDFLAEDEELLVDFLAEDEEDFLDEEDLQEQLQPLEICSTAILQKYSSCPCGHPAFCQL